VGKKVVSSTWRYFDSSNSSWPFRCFDPRTVCACYSVYSGWLPGTFMSSLKFPFS